MNDTRVVDDRTRNRNRMFLIAIFVMFFGSMLVAGILRFSGWQPEGRRNHGELLDPPGDLRDVVPRLADGGEYRWADEARTWRIVAAPPAGCGTACDALARDLDTVWRLFGKDADRVDLLWICNAEGCMPPADARPRSLHLLDPDPRLRAALPRADAGVGGVPVYVIDPNGFVILRYPPGFDPAGLRADIAKLLKLI
ncbi:hypothetical protein N799_09520 [Lysobacter arseniciresistens ZS79]|uniref:Thioredoxin domain-containing protein n=1 Tax=Lysobacter arseniciresistens ZS79 TaxID=913325 RepID=A0A0A0EZ46_9GAMM|nr:hypothetical protein [Lysobacter arseniciresistens]KGM54382.1 hypothetical protein N799_09520 [Lysobacter arseniciresistens ZS79]